MRGNPRHARCAKPPDAGGDSNTGPAGVAAGPHAGFIPTLVDWLCAEYGETRESAFGTYPLACALALWPAAIERRGGDPTGPSAEIKAFLRAMKS